MGNLQRSIVILIYFICSVSGMSAVTGQEPQTRILKEQELVDMLVGSCIQSTRGCDPEQSIKKVKEALNQGKQFKLISTNNFPADWMVVAVQGLGGGGAWEHVIERTQRQNLPTITEAEANSRVVDLLSEHMGLSLIHI